MFNEQYNEDGQYKCHHVSIYLVNISCFPDFNNTLCLCYDKKYINVKHDLFLRLKHDSRCYMTRHINKHSILFCLCVFVLFLLFFSYHCILYEDYDDICRLNCKRLILPFSFLYLVNRMSRGDLISKSKIATNNAARF